MQYIGKKSESMSLFQMISYLKGIILLIMSNTVSKMMLLVLTSIIFKRFQTNFWESCDIKVSYIYSLGNSNRAVQDNMEVAEVVSYVK